MLCGSCEVKIEVYESVVVVNGTRLTIVEIKLKEEEVIESIACDVSCGWNIQVQGDAVYCESIDLGFVR